MAPSFAEAWGSVFICLLVSSAFNGCIAMQACSYFLRFKNDTLLMKCTVVVVWLGSTLHFACTCWVLHDSTILGYDRPSYDITIPLGISMGTALAAIVHFTVQGTYIFRIYQFGQNRYILAFCCLLVLFQLGLGLTWTGQLSAGNPFLLIYGQDWETKWIVTSFFTISAVVDVFITVSLSSQLMRNRRDSLEGTRHLIDKIMRWTIPTGMLTSAVAIAIVVVRNLQDSRKPSATSWQYLSSNPP
ncbi:hypothetical protein BD779DRAFT_1520486 [Infundibulicybe gibba]|nr:hypothetical protein BD779DRAFT_1520486 [Infundibulicybe gibba]